MACVATRPQRCSQCAGRRAADGGRARPPPPHTPGPLPTLQAYQPHVIARGLAASPGAAVGKLVFTAEAAEEAAAKGEHVILCRTVGGGEGLGRGRAAGLCC